MIYFDTNVLVYATIDQGSDKLARAEAWIEEAILKDIFCISPLVLSEYIFILSKLKIIDRHHDDIALYRTFVKGEIDQSVVLEAFKLCSTLSMCRNINDAMHVKMAEKYAKKLVTFDSDFKKLQKFTKVEIEIL